MNKMKLCAFLFLIFSFSAVAQVDYIDDGRPWKNRTNRGPDAEVPGWYYNLGITGIRARLVPDRPKTLLVKYVFKKSPAYGKVKTGDYITGAGGREFKKPHVDGYGMDKFGPQGPIEEFAFALEKSQGWAGKGTFQIDIERDGKKSMIRLSVGSKYGEYGKNYPVSCNKTDKIIKELLPFLVKNQHPNGSFGNPVDNLYTPLALMASGESKYLRAVKKCVYHLAEITKPTDRKEGLVNWGYMTAGIVMSEYYLRTKDRKILKEIQEVYDFLISSQYMDLKQLHPNQKKTHPDATPKDNKKANGGWGHNPGFEGYGPISMVTGEGALAFALMYKCGIKVDRNRLDKAYNFLQRGTGKNGYTWYGDEVANHNGYADMGRTGASAIAHWLSPYSDSKYKKFALNQAKCIGSNPLSFPDTHGSPILGMGFAALAANIDQNNFRKLMDANKWWFTMAQCHDGTFYYQPNRDNAGYGANSRTSASAVTALIFLTKKKNLYVTGRR